MTATDPKLSPAASNDAVFDLYLREDDEDQRSLRISMAVALAVHLGLLVVAFPALSGPVVPDAPKPRVIQLTPTPRFKKPDPPPPEQQKPREKVREVPVPDRTPDGPEPIRVDVPVLDSTLPFDDTFLRIPAAPPEEKAPVEEKVRVGGAIPRPERVYYLDPIYTEIARRSRTEGTVILEATIDRQGNVVGVTALKSLPFGLTDEAIKAVRQWRYTPTVVNGKAVEVLMVVTVRFELN